MQELSTGKVFGRDLGSSCQNALGGNGMAAAVFLRALLAIGRLHR